jgi:hypothetical protein
MTSAAPSAADARLQADRLAVELDRRGLAAPAAIVLDAHRAFLPLLRQGAIFFGPLLAPVIGPRRFATLRRVLEDPASYERLAARLAGDDRLGGDVVGPSDLAVGGRR